MKKSGLRSYKDFVFTDLDNYLFLEGTNYDVYKKMGAHPCEKDGVAGVYFNLWAPNAESVSIIAGFNGWQPNATMMQKTEQNIWALFVPGMKKGDIYKYVVAGWDGITRYKADPYAFESELRPSNASVVCGINDYDWQDGEYLAKFNPHITAEGKTVTHDSPEYKQAVLDRPIAIYEVHLGTWKKDYRLNEDGYLNYRDLADQLSEYVTYMGFTHVELIGICEYPFDGSWGYQVTGFYAPTKRYGTPEDFKYFVDKMHSCGIGVILDWVPAHFPKDTFGLESFDGTSLYEHHDHLRAEYPEWGTKAFNHGRGEVKSFLVGNAFYWINEYHVDALRVDAVAAMLYNSFGRGEWRPNQYGGSENIEAMEFIRQLNREVKSKTRAYLMAEDSSIMTGITSDDEGAALGFMFKWNMGWMNDTLKYIKKDPIFRKWHHEAVTHVSSYAYLENYILVLSHDEVVHLKKPMIYKFPGNMMDKVGALKAFYTYMMTFPGKKLLFMGQEFGESNEWDENREISWYLASIPNHREIMMSLKELLSLYKKYPVLHRDSVRWPSFQWVNKNDYWRSTFSYIRKDAEGYDGALLIVVNFTPVHYEDYTFGAPAEGFYQRVFSSYDSLYGAGGPDELGDIPPLTAMPYECDGYPFMLKYALRPYEAMIFEFPKK